MIVGKAYGNGDFPYCKVLPRRGTGTGILIDVGIQPS
jgi:hypothetical protein